MKYRIALILTILLFAGGFILVLYPVISEWNHSNLQKELNDQYISTVGEKKDEEIEAELKKVREYNKYVQEGRVVLSDPFDETAVLPSKESYEELLNVNGDRIMGFIHIPQISVEIPIYHSTDDEVMRKGAGHLPGTSFPIGGDGTHSVLSSHRGLSSAKLFTDLDKLEIGDEFYIYVLDRKLAYKVDQIKIVEPENISDLKIDDEEDYITLITCTPYSLNTHRLLVRGKRINMENQTSIEGNGLPKRNVPYPFYSICFIVITIIAIVIIYIRTDTYKEKKKCK